MGYSRREVDAPRLSQGRKLGGFGPLFFATAPGVRNGRLDRFSRAAAGVRYGVQRVGFVNVQRIFASAVIRKITYVLTGVAIWALLNMFGMGNARAAVADSHGDPGVAYAHCETFLAYLNTENPGYAPFFCKMVWSGAVGTSGGHAKHQTKTGNNYSWGTAPDQHNFPVGCTSPAVWNSTKNTCEVPNDCLTKTPVYAGWNSGPSVKFCQTGCEFAGDGSSETKNIKVDKAAGNGINFLRGMFNPTGNACTSGDPPPRPVDDFCTDTGGGNMICGDGCVKSGKTGRRYCPENGSINAADPDRTEAVSQTTPIPAPAPAPTPPAPRPGETFTPAVTAITTTTKPGGIPQVTNTTLYNNTGTPNKAPGAGVTGDGSNQPGAPAGAAGNGGAGQSGDAPKPGTASGGDTCVSPPAMTGDGVQRMIATQTWLSRCRGAGDTNGDGVPDFLGETLNEDQGNGVVDGKTGWDDTPPDEADLDQAGFGLSRSCPAPPTITIGGHSRTLDYGPVCSLGGIIGLLVLAAAFAHAAYIFGGNK